MGILRKPALVRLVIGILASDAAVVERVRPLLREKFGKEELDLPPFPFSFTNYYESEIGSAPVRAFTCYEKLIDREAIVDIKLWTNELELQLANEKGTPGLRPVNLDPGYMTLGQFFLATTKDQRQRVYIRNGIFVEPTLFFRKGISTLLTGPITTTKVQNTSSTWKQYAGDSRTSTPRASPTISVAQRLKRPQKRTRKNKK